MGLNNIPPSKHSQDSCFQWITTCPGITGDWDLYCNRQQEGYTYHIYAAEKDLFSQRQKAVYKFSCTLELDVNYYIHSITVAAIFGRLSHNVTSHDAGGRVRNGNARVFFPVFNSLTLIFCDSYKQWGKYTPTE